MIQIEKEKQLVVKFYDRLDATNAEQTAETISKELNPLDRDIVLDVEKLEYISSAGLQVVLKCAKAAKASGKEIFLRGAKGNVLEIFRLSGFLTFLKEI